MRKNDKWKVGTVERKTRDTGLLLSAPSRRTYSKIDREKEGRSSTQRHKETEKDSKHFLVCVFMQTMKGKTKFGSVRTIEVGWSDPSKIVQ